METLINSFQKKRPEYPLTTAPWPPKDRNHSTAMKGSREKFFSALTYPNLVSFEARLGDERFVSLIRGCNRNSCNTCKTIFCNWFLHFKSRTFHRRKSCSLHLPPPHLIFQAYHCVESTSSPEKVQLSWEWNLFCDHLQDNEINNN